MASFFQGVKNFFFGKGKEGEDEAEQQHMHHQHREAGHKRSRHNSRTNSYQPVLQDAGYSANGGVQGLGWYITALQLDADGDAAHAFYQEQQQAGNSSSSEQLQQVPGRPPSRHQLKSIRVLKGHVLVSVLGS